MTLARLALAVAMDLPVGTSVQGATLTLHAFTPSAGASYLKVSGERFLPSDEAPGQPGAQVQTETTFASVDVASGTLRAAARKSDEYRRASAFASLSMTFAYDGETSLVLDAGAFGYATSAQLFTNSTRATASAQSSMLANWLSMPTGEYPDQVGGNWGENRNCATGYMQTACLVSNNVVEAVIPRASFDPEGVPEGPNTFGYSFSAQSPEITLLPGGVLTVRLGFGAIAAETTPSFFDTGLAFADGGNSAFFSLELPTSVDFSLGAFADIFPTGVTFLRTTGDEPGASDGNGGSAPSIIPLPAAGWLLLASLCGLAALGRRRA
jgi:hypothetical protein